MKNIIVLIKKYERNYFLIKETKNKNIKNILNNYQGLEGENIYYLSDQVASKKMMNDILLCKELIKNEKKSDYSLLYLGDPQQDVSEKIKNQAIKIGYEYGFYKDELNFYSSIFHEIIFGNFAELISFKDKLNESYLFPFYEIAKKYASIHHQLLTRKIDVEDDEDMEIYEVWKII